MTTDKDLINLLSAALLLLIVIIISQTIYNYFINNLKYKYYETCLIHERPECEKIFQ